MRYAITGAVVGAVVALLLSLHAVGHALPVPGHKHWSAMSLTAKERYVKSNVAHARGALDWIRSHHATRELAGVVRDHRRLLRKATRNLRAIEAKLHPVFAYPWWWVPLGVCETGSNPPDPTYNGSDGYDGWINFLPSTWDTYKRYVPGASQYTYAYQAPEYMQYLVTMAMHNSGVPWSQSNPACSARIGLS